MDALPSLTRDTDLILALTLECVEEIQVGMRAPAFGETVTL